MSLWARCLIGWLFFLFEGMQIASFNALLPSLMGEDLHLSGLQVGFISSCYFYTVVLFLIPAGVILEYFSVKRSFLLAIIVSVSANLMFSFSHSFKFAIIAKLLAGCGAAFALLGNLKLNSLILPASKLNRGVGGVVMFGMLGNLLGQMPMIYLVKRAGWREALQLLSLLGYGILFLNIISFLTLPDFANTQPKINLLNIYQDMKQSLTNLQTWLAGIFIFCFDSPIMILGTLWGQMYVMQTFQFTPIAAASITTMLFLGVIMGSSLLSGYLDQTSNLKRTLLVCAIVMVLIMLVLTVLTRGSFSLLICLFFALGFFSTIQIAGYTVLYRNTPVHLQSIACSLASVLVMGLGTVLRLLFSWIMQLGWDGNQLSGVAIYSHEQYRNAIMIFLVALLLGCFIIKLFKVPQPAITFLN